MITDAILDVLFGVVNGIISLFPTFSIPPGPGFSALAAASIIIPFDTFAFWLGVTIAVGAVALAYKAIMVVINLIRGSGA